LGCIVVVNVVGGFRIVVAVLVAVGFDSAVESNIVVNRVDVDAVLVGS
jgi:hypothetical protein